MPSDPGINQFNEQWRASSQYREVLGRVGIDPSRPFRLTDEQRKRVQSELEARGVPFPDGVEIDPAGNMNEDEGFAKQARRWGPIIAAAAVTAFGIPGTQIGGLFGGGGAGAAGAGGAGAAFDAAPAISSALGASNAAGIGGLGAIGGALSGGGGLLGTLGRGANVLGSIGSIAGRAARGSAEQRLAETQGLLGQQGLAQQQARDTFNAGLSGANFQREGQDREQRAQVLQQLLNNTQDARITPGNPNIAARMPTMTGGARPSNLTTNREALMALLARPQIAAPTYQPPPAFRLPQQGRGERILGGIGLAGSLLGALGGLRR